MGAPATSESELNHALQAVVEAARAENGHLRLEWPMGVTDSLDDWRAAFNEMFRLDVDVQLDSYVEPGAVMRMLVEAAQAKKPAPADVVLGPFALFLRGGPQGPDVFEPFDWRSIAPEWPDGVVAPDDVSVIVYHQLVGFAYNTKLLDESDLPKRAADVIQLAARHPVASTSHAAGFPLLGSDDLMGREGILGHIRELSRVKAGLINPAEMDRIAKGDFAGLWLNGANNFVDRAAQVWGAPIAAVVLRDAAVTISWEVAVPRNASNPNTAKLWIYFMNTPTAQAIAYQKVFADNVLLDGSQLARSLANYEADGFEFVHMDYRYGREHPEVYDEDFIRQLVDTLSETE